jgi:signal transduction histidine kinase
MDEDKSRVTGRLRRSFPPVRLSAANTAAELPIGFVVIGADDVVRAWNSTAARVLGVPPENAVGRPFRDLEVSYRIEGLRAAVERVKADGAPLLLEDVVVAGEEGAEHLAISIRPAVKATPVRAVMLYITDMTTIVRLREDIGRLVREHALEMGYAQAAQEALEVTVEELSASNHELHMLNEALTESDHRKDEFIAMLAHELRNPLAAVVAALEVLDRGDADRTAVERARRTGRRQLRHLARLLDDLLDVSRLSHGRLELRKRVVDVASILAESVDALRHEIDAAGLALNLALPRVGSLYVDADETRLVQVVTNLLTNAVKNTPPGGKLTVAAERQGALATIIVQDTGRGIAPGDLERIFALFEQTADAHGGRSQGLGIGLTLARRVVELHGGTITATSAGVDRGSTFTVKLPLTTTPPAPAPASVSDEPAARPRHILVIEDNADVGEMFRSSLTSLGGHRVEVADSGARGVEMALAMKPEVVLIDIGLPDIDGYAVARKIRAVVGDSVRLVAVTGYGQPEDKRLTREAGFDAHVVKPADYEAIARVLAAF